MKLYAFGQSHDFVPFLHSRSVEDPSGTADDMDQVRPSTLSEGEFVRIHFYIMRSNGQAEGQWNPVLRMIRVVRVMPTQEEQYYARGVQRMSEKDSSVVAIGTKRLRM